MAEASPQSLIAVEDYLAGRLPVLDVYERVVNRDMGAAWLSEQDTNE